MSDEKPVKRGRGRPKGSRGKKTVTADFLYSQFAAKYKHEFMEQAFEIAAHYIEAFRNEENEREVRDIAARNYLTTANQIMPYKYPKPQVSAQEGEQGELVFTFSPEVREMFEGKKVQKNATH